MPRNFERFKHYLRTMVNDAGDDLAIPPLVIINPMAREHVPELLDQYIALHADQVAAQTRSEAEPDLAGIEGEYKMSLVMADDLKGAWTNRYTTEFGMRCGVKRQGEKAVRRAAWLAPVLWSSEPTSLTTVRQEVLMSAYRTAYCLQHGPSRTLSQMLAQEGYCMSKSGCTGPTFDEEELEFTRYVIAPYLQAEDMPTAIACLFGDKAARSLGFQTYGLSDRAGFALALFDARCGRSPRAVAGL